MDLDTREAVYSYIQGLLTTSVQSEPSCIRVDSLLELVKSAVQDACFDFAKTWNNERPGPMLERLPAEILSSCFRRLRFHDRVSVSHVSRSWRAAALADPLLWTTFSRTEPDDIEDQKTRKMIAQLSVMLERSRPAPFSLRVPKSNRGFFRLEERIFHVAGPEFARIQFFEGSFEIYKRLNHDGAAMPHLRAMKLITKPGSYDSVFSLPSTWGSTGAPNLRQLDLDGPSLSIPSDCAPLKALTHLTFYCPPSLDDFAHGHQETLAYLFDCCPNLVVLEVRGVTDTTCFPAGPMPTTIERVSLYAADGNRVNYELPLVPWTGHPIRQLELYGSRTFAHPLGHFLSSCGGPFEMEMLRAMIYLRQLAPAGAVPCSYTVYPFYWHNSNQLQLLRGAHAGRLTSLKLNVEHIGEVFCAGMHLPKLHTFEFQLDQYEAVPFPDALPDAGFQLVAPRLRRVCVKMPDMVFDRASADGPCARALVVLRDHLRDLIKYDTAPLDSVTVCGPRKVLAALPCAELAHLATAYVERTDQYA